MLYLLTSEVQKPVGIPDSEWEELLELEFQYGADCRRNGFLRNIWRIAGKYAAVSVWEAKDHEHFHQLISGLPLFPFAEFAVTPLVEHPSTVRLADAACEGER